MRITTETIKNFTYKVPIIFLMKFSETICFIVLITETNIFSPEFQL